MKSVLFLAMMLGATVTHAAFTETAKKTAATAKFCPESVDGKNCRMTFEDAKAYCASIQAKLPTVREFAAWSTSFGAIGILEEKQVKGKAPEGYYLVASVYDDGTKDAFYFNHNGYIKPQSELAHDMFWTLSTALQSAYHAHVFYGEFGGGGGKPEEHLKTYKNAVICSQ